MIARILFFMAFAALCPCASGGLVGGYGDVSVTGQNVTAAVDFAVKARASAGGRADNGRRPALELLRVVQAEEQVVAGTNYRLKLAVKEGGKERTAVAIVWWQPWRKPDPYRLTSWEWQ